MEFCCATLAKNSPGWDAANVRSAMIGYLKELEKQDAIQKFGKKVSKALLKA